MNNLMRNALVHFSVALFASLASAQVYENHVGQDEVEPNNSWFTLESELRFGAINSGGDRTASFFGGWSFPDYRDRVGAFSYPSTRLIEGSTAGFAIGKKAGPRMRSEFEFTWRNNDASSFYDWGLFSILPYYDATLQGEVNSYSGMYNLIYEFDRASERLLTPYLGVGIGLSYADTDVSWRGIGETISNETAFSYQAVGGVSARITPVADFFVEYRYFATDSVEYTQPAYEGTYSSVSERSFYHSFQSHMLLMGLRFKF